MSYLETQLKFANTNIVAPAKEGGLAALANSKVWAGVGIYIHTVPLFHHSFNLWKKAVLSNSDYVLNQIVNRCFEQCVVDVNMLKGAYSTLVQDSLAKCKNQCNSDWTSIYQTGLLKNKNDTERVFNVCLSESVKNEIQYENVLNCKQKAFTHFLDLSLDSERDLLNMGLNRYS